MADISKEQAVQLARESGAVVEIGLAPVFYTHDQIHDFAKAAYTLGRNAGLEEAKQKCKQLEVAIDGAGNTYYRPADARQCVAAIESLKDNTP